MTNSQRRYVSGLYLPSKVGIVNLILPNELSACTVTPDFKVKPNAHSMCVQESNLHTHRTKNRYRITNVIIYSIYYYTNIDLQKTN
jgi:hypothetical protein